MSNSTPVYNDTKDRQIAAQVKADHDADYADYLRYRKIEGALVLALIFIVSAAAALFAAGLLK